MVKYRVVRGNEEATFSNAKSVALYVGCHYGELATEFGLRKKQSAYINGYYIERVKKLIRSLILFLLDIKQV